MTTRKAYGANGFALIDLIFVCGIIGVLCSVALPRLLLAQQSAGAASAIGSMRAINSGELTFAITCGGGFYAPALTVLGDAPPGSNDAFLSQNLTTADTINRAGYTITLEATPYDLAPASCNGLGAGEAGQAFKAGADPNQPNAFRYFAINANGQIWEDTASLYTDMPEVGDPLSGHVLR